MSASDKHNILRNILGRGYQSGDEHLFYCPKCDHHKAKLSVNIDKNVFKCWICDYVGTSIYRLVRRYGNHEQRKRWKELDGIVELDRFEQSVHDLFEEGGQEPEEILSLPEEFVSLTSKKVARSGQIAKNYLLNRGLTQEDITFWKVGYCSEGEYGGRIVVPSFNQKGRVNYFVARTYLNDWRKYMNPQVSKSNMVFNHLYLDFDEDLIITEGIFDAMVAGKNSVPILGSTLKDASLLFQEIVKNDTPVYVALDHDAEKKALMLINKLLKYGIEIHKVDISPHADVAEMTRGEFLERKEKATLLTQDNYLLHKIKNMF